VVDVPTPVVRARPVADGPDEWPTRPTPRTVNPTGDYPPRPAGVGGGTIGG